MTQRPVLERLCPTGSSLGLHHEGRGDTAVYRVRSWPDTRVAHTSYSCEDLSRALDLAGALDAAGWPVCRDRPIPRTRDSLACVLVGKRGGATASWSGAQTGRHLDEGLVVPAGRALRLVVVADTHSRPHPASHGFIAALAPDAILHAGDIGSLELLDRLRDIAPTIAVRGNIDAPAPEVPDTVALRINDDDDRAVLTLLLTHIGLTGPRLRADTARAAGAHQAAMVVCGHSHVPFIGYDRDLVVFNPGSIGPRRFALPITFGVMEVSRAKLDLRHISAETGAPWSP